MNVGFDPTHHRPLYPDGSQIADIERGRERAHYATSSCQNFDGGTLNAIDDRVGASGGRSSETVGELGRR
jgi:hypothetical protein